MVMADKAVLLITDIYRSDSEQLRREQLGALLDEYLRAMLSEEPVAGDAPWGTR